MTHWKPWSLDLRPAFSGLNYLLMMLQNEQLFINYHYHTSFLLYQAFFCNSGAEANEAAIKLARKYAHTKLNIDFPVIITAVNSFHGRTLTTITATGQAKYQKDFGPLTPGFEYTDYNDLAALKEKVKSKGSKVEGNYRGKGKYYPGKITRVRLNGTFDISYDDGEKEIGVA